MASLPVWPVYSLAGTDPIHIPALGARFTMIPEFLMPWVLKLNTFVDPATLETNKSQMCITSLGAEEITDVKMLQEYLIPNFPSSMLEIGESSFKLFIDAVAGIPEIKYATSSGDPESKDLITRLRSVCLAPDNLIGKMHQPTELFDHTDSIFRSAFGDSKIHFLHVSVREYMAFWKRIGLRHRTNNVLDAQDYIECLSSITNLINSSEYGVISDRNTKPYHRMKTVLEPFIAPSHAASELDVSNWRTIAAYPVFLVERNHDWERYYRRDNTNRISEVDISISLSEVVLYRYVAVCWSQMPFVVLEPTAMALSHIRSDGAPSILQVFKHIGHLKDLSFNIKKEEMPDLVSDLLQSYEFLQARLEESVVCFTAYADKIAKKDIWFNLDTTNTKDICLEDAKEAWTPIRHLLLISSTDAPPLMSIRQTLMSYEKLLRALGAKSVYHPTIEPPEERSYQSLSANLSEMRNNGDTVDIVFISDNVRVPAHKMVLSCASTYCKSSFSGRWSDNGEIILDEMTSHTLCVLVNSAYEEPIDWEEMTVDPEKLSQDLDANDKKLNLLINLHKGADYWGMLALANQVEKRILEQFRLFIRLDNVREYQEMAANSNAVVFEQACRKFCEKNEAALRGWEEAVAALQSVEHDS